MAFMLLPGFFFRHSSCSCMDSNSNTKGPAFSLARKAVKRVFKLERGSCNKEIEKHVSATATRVLGKISAEMRAAMLDAEELTGCDDLIIEQYHKPEILHCGVKKRPACSCAANRHPNTVAAEIYAKRDDTRQQIWEKVIEC